MVGTFGNHFDIARMFPEDVHRYAPGPTLGGQEGSGFVVPAHALNGWDALALRLGLAPAPERGVVWSATRGGATLCVAIEPVDGNGVRVAAVATAPRTLMAVRRALALCRGGDLMTGDTELDEESFIASPDATVLGVLDEPTRNELRSFLRVGGTIGGGQMRLPAAILAGGPGLAGDALALMFALAERLAVPREARVAGIVAIARHDPNPRVREELRRRFSAEPEVRACAEKQHVGDDGDVLLARLSDPWLPPEAGPALVEALFRRTDLVELAPRLRELHGDVVPLAVEQLAAALGARAMVGVPTGLVCVAHLDHHPALTGAQRATLFDALGRAGDARLGPWLAQAANGSQGEVFDAAVGALMRLAGPGSERVGLLSDAARAAALEVVPRLLSSDANFGGDFLVALLERAQGEGLLSREHLVAGLEALAVTGDAACADFGVATLDSTDTTVRAAAMRLVARSGVARHVAGLGRFTEGVFRSAGEKALARDAIAAIHRRIGTERGGGMALATDAAGGLALSHGLEPKRRR